MQQVFFQETEFLNSVIDYDHKVETENLCLDIAYGTDKNFLFGCGISIASILKYNEGSRLCFHIFTDYFGVVIFNPFSWFGPESLGAILQQSCGSGSPG